MIFEDIELSGAYVLIPERKEDYRGFFARTWDALEFQKRGLACRLAQCSISFNEARGTLRGMHFQAEPHGETKIVRCTRGAIYDVIIDLRRDSSTFKRWFGIQLSGENRVAVYIPRAFAHGFVTLEDKSEVYYEIAGRHVAAAAAGVRWNDPAFSITWPIEPTVMAERDAAYPDFVR